MHTVLVSAEVSPYAKAGGLADVASALPRALNALGIGVRLIMPSTGALSRKHHWKRSLASRFLWETTMSSALLIAVVSRVVTFRCSSWGMITTLIEHRSTEKVVVITLMHWSGSSSSRVAR